MSKKTVFLTENSDISIVENKKDQCIDILINKKNDHRLIYLCSVPSYFDFLEEIEKEKNNTRLVCGYCDNDSKYNLMDLKIDTNRCYIYDKRVRVTNDLVVRVASGVYLYHYYHFPQNDYLYTIYGKKCDVSSLGLPLSPTDRSEFYFTDDGYKNLNQDIMLVNFYIKQIGKLRTVVKLPTKLTDDFTLINSFYSEKDDKNYFLEDDSNLGPNFITPDYFGTLLSETELFSRKENQTMGQWLIKKLEKKQKEN